MNQIRNLRSFFITHHSICKKRLLIDALLPEDLLKLPFGGGASDLLAPVLSLLAGHLLALLSVYLVAVLPGHLVLHLVLHCVAFLLIRNLRF